MTGIRKEGTVPVRYRTVPTFQCKQIRKKSNYRTLTFKRNICSTFLYGGYGTIKHQDPEKILALHIGVHYF